MVEARVEGVEGISRRAGVGCGWASGALKAGYQRATAGDERRDGRQKRRTARRGGGVPCLCASLHCCVGEGGTPVDVRCLEGRVAMRESDGGR
jgi:hypothetical protein